MVKFKVALRFIILFVFAYTLMVVPVTRIYQRYTEFLCSTGNRMFRNYSSNKFVFLSPRTDGEKGDIILQLKFILEPSGEIRKSRYNISVYMLGFIPTVFFLSLVIATPLSWKRKTVALSLGFFLITCFALLRLRIIILSCLTLTTGRGLVPEESSKESLLFWYKYFVEPMSLGFSFAIILWLGLCIGKKEWQKLNGVISESLGKMSTGNPDRNRKSNSAR